MSFCPCPVWRQQIAEKLKRELIVVIQPPIQLTRRCWIGQMFSDTAIYVLPELSFNILVYKLNNVGVCCCTDDIVISRTDEYRLHIGAASITDRPQPIRSVFELHTIPRMGHITSDNYCVGAPELCAFLLNITQELVTKMEVGVLRGPDFGSLKVDVRYMEYKHHPSRPPSFLSRAHV